ncbi:HIT family protein [Streptomyces sp. NPDC086838]|uniref:HIT family protein n=1 Tax=Streptomyces sp. NPDC086838 TaxID=3365762 RepID=UPI0037F64D03
MDLEAYEARARSGPCFICALVAGEPGHVTVHEDDWHLAFLDRCPTVPGKVLVAPRRTSSMPSAILRNPLGGIVAEHVPAAGTKRTD